MISGDATTEENTATTMATTDYDWTAFVVLPTYLAVSLATFGLSTGLMANYYLFRERTQ